MMKQVYKVARCTYQARLMPADPLSGQECPKKQMSVACHCNHRQRRGNINIRRELGQPAHKWGKTKDKRLMSNFCHNTFVIMLIM